MLFRTPKATLPPRAVSGRSLPLRKLSAPQRAAMAAMVLNHETDIDHSVVQVSQLFGVSLPYIKAALKFTPEMRQRIAAGNASPSFTGLTKWTSLPKPVTDVQLAVIIRDVGIDRTLAVACAVESAA
jgi:hypothetical protein